MSAASPREEPNNILAIPPIVQGVDHTFMGTLSQNFLDRIQPLLGIDSALLVRGHMSSTTRSRRRRHRSEVSGLVVGAGVVALGSGGAILMELVAALISLLLMLMLLMLMLMLLRHLPLVNFPLPLQLLVHPPVVAVLLGLDPGEGVGTIEGRIFIGTGNVVVAIANLVAVANLIASVAFGDGTVGIGFAWVLVESLGAGVGRGLGGDIGGSDVLVFFTRTGTVHVNVVGLVASVVRGGEVLDA
jgi:hypothetical protein